MKRKPNLLDYLLRTAVGAVLFLLIGTVIGYLIFVQYYDMENIYALIGFVVAALTIVLANIFGDDSV